MKLWPFTLLAVVACSDTTTNPVTELNLDRPVDISFACYGGLRITQGEGTGDVITSAQPLSSCTFRSGPRAKQGDPEPKPPGQETIGDQEVGSAWWYAFILQSAPGTVAVARFDAKPALSFGGSDVTVLDTDPLTPGKNSISVGEDPVAIATDRVGCFEVVANAGSCDLSTLDVNTALKAAEGESSEPLVKRLEVTNAAGEVVRARPAAMVFEPAGGTIGAACPAQPTGLAYIAYPGCHMVAGVDTATGTIVTSITFDALGVPTVGDGNVSCPAECDGAAITPGVRPVALDLEADPRTGRIVLAIGADNSHFLTVYDLDNQTLEPLSLIPPIALEDPTDRLGVTAVSITPVIGMGGDAGNLVDEGAPGGDHQFIYAVATDASVRVADISGTPQECDAQIDPRYLRDVRDINRLACIPVTDPTKPPRRQGARGPGIQLLGDAVPTGVDVAKVERLQPEQRTPPRRLIGYFGLISSADGNVYVFNVDDDDFADFVDPADPLATAIPLDIPHQLRDTVTDRGLKAEQDGKFVCNDPGPAPTETGVTSGGIRIEGAPTNVLPAGVLATEKTGGLPSIRQVLCDVEGEEDDRPVNELFFSAPLDVRDEVFPDLMGMHSDEGWTLTWEGPLSRDGSSAAVDGPAVRTSQMVVDPTGMHLVDTSRPFCDAGVQPYDIVQFRGCDPTIGDAGCPIGYTCYVHPQSQVTGIGSCMLVDEAERLANACKPFLTSLRRYTVGTTKSGELQLLPRKVALRTTPVEGCDTDDQCEALADYALRNASSRNPGDPDQPTDPKTWRCAADPDRKPIATGKRCLLACDSDADCNAGTVCQENPAALPQKGYCMEGVMPPQACVNAPQRYELRAGEAFAVVGSRHGFLHPIIADAGDVCVADPAANPLQVGRIPLDPPDCDPTADPRTGKLPDGSFDANPCKVTVQETEYQLNYVAGTCTLGDPDESIVTRDATGLRFRNPAMNLTLVDPTYQGDLMCHGDRQGMLQDIPLVPPGFQIAFRLTAGFTPLTIAGISPALPIKVVRGPTESLWVIDEGDFLSTSIGLPSTRGRVYRIESVTINTVNVVQ